jgi:hypothetical protein
VRESEIVRERRSREGERESTTSMEIGKVMKMLK